MTNAPAGCDDVDTGATGQGQPFPDKVAGATERIELRDRVVIRTEEVTRTQLSHVAAVLFKRRLRGLDYPRVWLNSERKSQRLDSGSEDIANAQ